MFDIIKIALTAAVIGFLIRYFVLRPMKVGDKNSGLDKSPHRKALRALFEAVSNFSFWLVISAMIALALSYYLTQLSGSNAEDARKALDSVRGFKSKISNFTDLFSMLATVIVLLALGGLIYYASKAAETKRLNALVTKEKDLLKADINDNDVDAAIEGIDGLKQAVTDRKDAVAQLESLRATILSQATPENEAETEAATAEIEARIDELKTDLSGIRDVARDISVTMKAADNVNTQQQAEANMPATKKKGVFAKLFPFFVSEGMLNTASAGLKLLAILAVLLFVPTTLAVTLKNVEKTANAKDLELTSLVQKYDFDVTVAAVTQDFEQTFNVTALEQASQVELSDEDEAIVMDLARIVEDQVIPRPWVASTRASSTSSRNIARQSVRNRILSQQGSRRAAITADAPRAPSAAQTEALDILRKSDTVRGPQTKVGQKAADNLRRVARTQPQKWAVIKTQTSNYIGSFSRAASPQQIRSLATSQLIGDLIPSFDRSGSVMAQNFMNSGANIAGGTTEAFVETATKKFTTDLAKGVPMADAISAIDPIAKKSFTPREISAIQRFSEKVPDRAKLSEMASSADNRVHIRSMRGAMYTDDTVRALSGMSRAVGQGSVQLGQAMASYQDYFPSKSTDAQTSSWAKASRQAKFADAPPRVGAASRAYQRTAMRNVGMARSYTKLRGFARVGGVLIGRDPVSTGQDEGVTMTAFDWVFENQKIKFILTANDNQPRTFGPYDPAVVNLALAYAADGRPTTVTMVSADPLAELKILTHVALIDTGLGCRARRLDQFADEMTSEDILLDTVRNIDTQNATAEVALYNLSRALRVKQILQVSPAVQDLGDKAISQFSTSADNVINNKQKTTLAASALGQNKSFYMRQKPEFFDVSLLDIMRSCRAQTDVAAYSVCLRGKVAPISRISMSDDSLDWAAPGPEYEIWSGVREDEYSVSKDMAFMLPTGDAQIWPFSFIVQLAVNTPAYFVEGAKPWHSEDNPKVEEYVDEKPWEFPDTEKAMNRVVARGVRANAERQDVMSSMRGFAVMQRLFRALLDGHIDAEFNLEKLAVLDNETAAFVNDNAPTLRWNHRQGQLESQLLSMIGNDTPLLDKEATTSCRAFIEEQMGQDAAKAGVNLAAVSSKDWNAVCGGEMFTTDDLKKGATYISAARDLRLSLNVDEDIHLSGKYASQGCPAP